MLIQLVILEGMNARNRSRRLLKEDKGWDIMDIWSGSGTRTGTGTKTETGTETRTWDQAAVVTRIRTGAKARTGTLTGTRMGTYTNTCRYGHNLFTNVSKSA